jgi:hypothetical protein
LIYLGSSVALAQLLGEDRSPPDTFWQGPLVSSRLLEYVVWNRVRAQGLGSTVSGAMRTLIGRLRLVELIPPPVLARALQPFPVPVRTVDALHLATIDFVRGQGETVELASYDNRLLAAARALGVALSDL